MIKHIMDYHFLFRFPHYYNNILLSVENIMKNSIWAILICFYDDLNIILMINIFSIQITIFIDFIVMVVMFVMVVMTCTFSQVCILHYYTLKDNKYFIIVIIPL